MLLSRILAGMLAVGMVVGAEVASTQPYPSKPIRIVTTGVGGGNDFTARLIAQGIAVPLGQAVIVENRPGNLPGEIVSQAPPDGYTLLVHGTSFWNAPLIQSVSYDPVKDFSPVVLAHRSPNVLVVHPSLPVKSVKDLIALARARPGQLNYTSATSGSASHLTAELFKAMARVNIVRVGYTSRSMEIADLLSGQVHLTFSTPAVVAPLIKSGRLRALAVGSAEPSALFPGLPTVAAILPGFESASMSGVFAPAKTPAVIITRLNQETVRFLNLPEVRERSLNSGVDTVAGSPEQFAATVKSEMIRLGKVVKDAGIKAE